MREPPHEKILPWLGLKSVPGIGNILFKRLIGKFHSPASVFGASVEELIAVEGVSRRLAGIITTYKISEKIRTEVEETLAKGYHFVTLSDENYPPLLRHIPDPPPYLYVFGRLFSTKRNLAIVGSRNPTSYGISGARQLCRDLAVMGFTIVSGMARGIDTAAHEGALLGKGRTIAVLGSGFSCIYPSENKDLFHRIGEQGAVVSEFSLNTRPEPHNFPVRNRIISGMSLGTVVVEAAKKSGSLITARLAAEQNREVFAVPGSIRSFKSAGTHNLIKQGAKLVEFAGDIVEELYLLPEDGVARADDSNYHGGSSEKSEGLSADEIRVLKALGPYPSHIDELVQELSMAPGLLSGILLKLELEGIVGQSPGKLFYLKESD